uniref:DUF3800 domain-containing protein n=1 Tax=Rheinheimera sp. TaxID=1869214 RepID=UPI0040489288
MKNSYVQALFLDESGNNGDVISRKNNLSFAGQPVFALAAVDVSKIENFETRINTLKRKYRIQAKELKAADLYKPKPQFLLEVFSLIVDSESPFFIEVVDKKYYIAASIAAHQVIPPYFTGDESDGRQQFLRNLVADFMALQMPDAYYERFFESCFEPSEKTLLHSMEGLKEFFREHPDHAPNVKNVDMSIEDYFDLKKNMGDEAVKKFIPIPDEGKKGYPVYLLPHVSSLTNIIARVNLANGGSIEGVNFFHDKQDHFDEILITIKEQMVCDSPKSYSTPTPNSDFYVKTSANLSFSDSEKTFGIQIADLLAGFFTRYYEGISDDSIDDDSIYHKIYLKISEGFDQSKSNGVNWVIPQSRLYEVEHFHQFGFKNKPSPRDLIEYMARNLGVALN